MSETTWQISFAVWSAL